MAEKQLWNNLSEITGPNPMSYLSFVSLMYRTVFCKGFFK